MRDSDGFPNPYDFEPDDDAYRDDPRERDEYERDRQFHFGTHDDESYSRPRRRGHHWGFTDIRGVGSAAGYSGFGGPGWTSGGFGDPGYDTSGFGSAGAYGTSRQGASDYPGGTARTTSGNSEGPFARGRLAGDTPATSPAVPRGEHYGKGPRNYKRSDDRIREDICDRLTHHHDIDATDIEVSVSNGEVTLSGLVDDRNAKWLAEDLVERVPGVNEVRNQIRTARSKIPLNQREGGGR